MSRYMPDEWVTLAEQWRSAPERAALPIDVIRRRVQRQTVRLYALAGLEVVVTVVALGSIAVVLLGAIDWAARILAIALLVFTMRIWVFTILNRRGIWRPAAHTLEGFRALERLRMERKLASAQFVWRFCSLTLLAAGAWTAWRAPYLSAQQLWVMAAVGVYLVAWIVGGLLVRREVMSQLAHSRADDEWQNGASVV